MKDASERTGSNDANEYDSTGIEMHESVDDVSTGTGLDDPAEGGYAGDRMAGSVTAGATRNTPKVLAVVLFGFLAFLVSGCLGNGVILLWDQYIGAALVAGAIGGLLLGLFLRLKGKIVRIALAGGLGIPLGIVVSFGLIEGLGALVTLPASVEWAGVPDIMAIMLMGVVFGVMTGGIVFGKDAIVLFLVVCGLVAIPFGVLVVAMNKGLFSDSFLVRLLAPVGKPDLNFLAIVIGLGLGAGLSIGLFVRRKR